MGNYIRSGLKILYDYALTLLIFGIFAYIFMSIAGGNYGRWLPLYSVLIFLIAFFIIYSEEKKLGAKEKRPQYDLQPYPVKGLVYGLIGFFPIIVLEVVSVLIVFGNAVSDNLKHIILNFLMGPEFFIIKALGEQPLGYVLASLVIPLVSMLGYMAGFYGFELRKSKKADRPGDKKFEKSPWNPTNKPTASAKRNKKQPKKV